MFYQSHVNVNYLVNVNYEISEITVDELETIHCYTAVNQCER